LRFRDTPPQACSRSLSELTDAALLAGLVVGVVSFLAGFVGPIILRPDSNQGPLLGIFITGPVGFVLGGLGGFVWSRMAGQNTLRSEYRRKPRLARQGIGTQHI
jgi:hypothetical protein